MSGVWTGLLFLVCALTVLGVIFQQAAKRWKIHPELLRKMIHVSVGLTALALPSLFKDAWPVWLVAGAAAAALAASKFVPRLPHAAQLAFRSVGRGSVGEICFPVSVAVLFALTPDERILYYIPVLVLSLADATAALIGVRYGSFQYQTSSGTKSIEGSLAFLVVAFLSVHILLLLSSAAEPLESILIALILGLLVMAFESISSGGFDNITIPLGAYALLRVFLRATPSELGVHLAATVVLAAFVLAWRRRSTLIDTALIAVSLFFYAAAMIGGWAWLIPPLALFLYHCAAYPRRSSDVLYSVRAVAAVTYIGLACLFAATALDDPRWMYPFSVAFGAELVIFAVARNFRKGGPTSLARFIPHIALAWALALWPLALFAVREQSFSAIGGRGQNLSLLVAVSGLSVYLGAWAFRRMALRIYQPPIDSSRIYLAVALSALLAAATNATAVAVAP